MKFCHHLTRLSIKQENISPSKQCESHFNRYDYHIVLHHKPHINGHAQDCFPSLLSPAAERKKTEAKLERKHTDNVFQLPKPGQEHVQSFMVSKYESCCCFKAVPLQLVDGHSLPSVLGVEETVSILESEETVWEEQCASVHTTRTHEQVRTAFIKLNTAILMSRVWRNSRMKFTCRVNSCVGVPGCYRFGVSCREGGLYWECYWVCKHKQEKSIYKVNEIH